MHAKTYAFCSRNGQGCGIAGLGGGLRASPPTRVFGFVFLGVLGLGPRGLILEFEDIRKHTLFALENGQGCGIAGIGAAGSRLQHVFLGLRVLGWDDIAGNFRYRRFSATMASPAQKHRFLHVKNTIFGRGRPPGPP